MLRQEDYPLVLTAKDMREILQCGRETFYEYARSKGFPRLKGSRTIRVPRDAFFQWLEESIVLAENTGIRTTYQRWHYDDEYDIPETFPNWRNNRRKKT